MYTQVRQNVVSRQKCQSRAVVEQRVQQPDDCALVHLLVLAAMADGVLLNMHAKVLLQMEVTPVLGEARPEIPGMRR